MIFRLYKSRESAIHILEYLLLGTSSVLLGIWATKNTIALRNILLGVGFVLGGIFIYLSYKQDFFKAVRFKNCLPIALMALMFLWVTAHFYFFSQYPEIQLQELKSTWLRAFLAMIIGVSTGFAIQKHVKLINFLWLGIGLSFLYLIFQYVPRAHVTQNLFVIDWYGGYYIYIGKINAVLMGSILFCGLGAAWIDRLRDSSSEMGFANTILPLLGMSLTVYTYVFIFDTRNGLGISALLSLIWILYALIWFLLQDNLTKLVLRFKGAIFLMVGAIGIFSWLAFQQINHNPGWLTIIEDAKIAVQIDKYSNWQDLERLGYPRAASGRVVANNTYERVAWATAGARLIPENIFGVGVLAKPFMRIIQKTNPEITASSTHSAWIEFTLAFGLPGIFFVFGTLISIVYLAIATPNFYFRVSTVSLSLTLVLLYSVGELSTQHGVEVLFYLMALLAGLLIPIGIFAPVENVPH